MQKTQSVQDMLKQAVKKQDPQMAFLCAMRFNEYDDFITMVKEEGFNIKNVESLLDKAADKFKKEDNNAKD